jgi:O-antigen ligase
MRPSVVLLGFLLGSSGAISFGLLGVAFVFWVLQPEHPQLNDEIGSLLNHLARFALLTAAAAASFYAVLKARPWRLASLTALAAILTFVVWSYLP